MPRLPFDARAEPLSELQEGYFFLPLALTFVLVFFFAVFLAIATSLR